MSIVSDSLVAIVFAAVFLLSSTAQAETLQQAIARAVQYFPEIQAAQSRRDASAAQTGQARAEFFPSVNASLGEGRETSRNISTRTLGGDVTLTRQEAEVTITQLVFDGGAAGGQVRRFGARAEGAAFTVTDAAENAGFRAGQAFTEVRRLREQLGIARENVATHERTLSDVNALADAGRGRRADVTQAEARRALAVSAVEQLSGQLSQAEAAYRYLTGRMPGDLDAPPELAAKLPQRMGQAIDLALAAHPAVQAAEKELDAAQYDRESARARLVAPRVTIEAGASRNRDIDGITGPNQDHYAMLRLRYNLFRGFGDSERVRETAARIDEAVAGVQRVRNEVERDVRQAWEALAADRARLPQLARYARASSDVSEAYRLQFQLGQRSLLDVLNAENERFNASASYIAGREAVTAGEIRVLASLGRLLETFGIERGNTVMTEGSLPGQLNRWTQPDPMSVRVASGNPTDQLGGASTNRERVRQTAKPVRSLKPEHDVGERVVVDAAEAAYWRSRMDRVASVLHGNAPADADRKGVAVREHQGLPQQTAPEPLQ